MRAILIAAFASISLFVAVAAHADKAADAAKKQIAARYAGISKAFQKHDAAAMSEPLLPDYTLKQPNGTVIQREAIVQSVQQQAAAMNNAKWIRRIEKLKLDGDTATVTVHGEFDATLGKDNAQKFHMSTETTDVWTRQGKKWMLKSSEVLKNDVTMDGKSTAPPTR